MVTRRFIPGDGMAISRRTFLGTASLVGLGGAMAVPAASGQSPAADLVGALVPGADFDQTETVQAAIDMAARTGGHVVLPAGRYRTRTLRLPGNLTLSGVPGATILVHGGDEPLLLAEGVDNLTLTGIGADGSGAGGETWHGGLIHIAGCENVVLRDCRIAGTALNGITVLDSSGTIEGCAIEGSAYTGIFVYDARGVRIAGNTITDCGNGGIRVWRGEAGPDGTLVTGNRISGIDWTDGGNGQNGNGINIFRADGVTVSDNHISDCAFSAVRLNTTNNTQIVGNTCLDCREVAVFSEFAFTGSIIAGNIIDRAAAGISMTNYNDGGRLAACTGNIVRNLHPGSETNPDLDTPYGIAAEADAVISGNLIENVPGTGISAGWGPYLRAVTITGNLVREVDYGVVVSVAQGAGSAAIHGNTIADARLGALVGGAWWDVVSADLAADAGRFPQISIGENTIL